jgi:hypothetical protein
MPLIRFLTWFLCALSGFTDLNSPGCLTDTWADCVLRRHQVSWAVPNPRWFRAPTLHGKRLGAAMSATGMCVSHCLLLCRTRAERMWRVASGKFSRPTRVDSRERHRGKPQGELGPAIKKPSTGARSRAEPRITLCRRPPITMLPTLHELHDSRPPPTQLGAFRLRSRRCVAQIRGGSAEIP